MVMMTTPNKQGRPQEMVFIDASLAAAGNADRHGAGISESGSRLKFSSEHRMIGEDDRPEATNSRPV